MSSKKNAYLISLSDDGQWLRIPINGELEIRRHEKNAITAKYGKKNVSLGTHDQSVTRGHARIYWDDGKLYLQDIGSLNGTWISGCTLPGWYKEKEKRKRPTSDPVEIDRSTTVFFGPYTGATISFNKYFIPIEQSKPTVLPLDKTVDHPLDFFGVYRQEKRFTVVPHFTGEMDIRNDKISVKEVESERELPDEERLKRCNQFVVGAMNAWHRRNYTIFDASICTVIETCRALSNQSFVVRDVLDEEERWQHHKKERARDPIAYKTSCERMVEKLDTLSNYIINICQDQAMKDCYE